MNWDKMWGWIVNVFMLGNNVKKMLDKQDDMENRLKGVEEAIKAPRWQLEKLELLRGTVDLLEKKNSLEIEELKKDHLSEKTIQDKRIKNLQEHNKEMAKYRELVIDTIEVLKEKNKTIEELSRKIAMLEKTTPSSFSDAIAESLITINPKTVLGGSSKLEVTMTALQQALSKRKIK